MPDPTPQQVFEDVMAPLLQTPKVKARALKIGAVFQWRITGPKGGDWVIDTTAENLGIRRELNEKAQVTLHASDTNFVAMAMGRLNPTTAHFSGQLACQGDWHTYLRYPEIFPPLPIEGASDKFFIYPPGKKKANA